MGCRNTVFNCEAQTALPYLNWLSEAGYRNFRIELVDEPPEFIEPLIRKYSEAIDLAVTHADRSLYSGTDSLSDSDGENSWGHDMDGSYPKNYHHDNDDNDGDDISGTGYAFGGFLVGAEAVEAEMLQWLEQVPDSNGRRHGVTEGSLRPVEERHWNSLRPTAKARAPGYRAPVPGVMPE